MLFFLVAYFSFTPAKILEIPHCYSRKASYQLISGIVGESNAKLQGTVGWLPIAPT
jgi:hypothetical protein